MVKPIATELVVSATILKQSIRDATIASGSFFTGRCVANVDGESEDVEFYAANIVENCIDRHVVVVGKTTG